MGIVAGAPNPPPVIASGESALDAAGVRHGTALSSLGRDCLRGWDRFLAPFREQAFDLLEIGIGDGASLRTWREWFPFAHLVGLDARRLRLDPPIPGCTIVQGNQAEPETLRRLVRDHRFRIVIDDGSRHPDDQLAAFRTLFPWLEPGAVYFCAGFPDEIDGVHHTDRAAAAWFAELGRLVIEDDIKSSHVGNERGHAAILARTQGVFLMRGSAVVVG